MLKIRVMPTLLYRGFGLVKGLRFDNWRSIGAAMQAIRVYNLREVDELVFLDIEAGSNGRGPDFDLIDELADECFMPLTVGGGIQQLSDVEKLIGVGADKVSLNTTYIRSPGIVREAARIFGSQAIIVSLDAMARGDGTWEVYIDSGKTPTGMDVVAAAQMAEDMGAGEILLTSILRDGSMEGYDLTLLKAVTEKVSIPVIASGGAGHYQHMVEAILQGNAAAVAAASIFHFTECTPKEAKLFLREQGIPVRL
jgi:imidazole glycerol-phosphate synthase subunit HisF